MKSTRNKIGRFYRKSFPGILQGTNYRLSFYLNSSLSSIKQFYLPDFLSRHAAEDNKNEYIASELINCGTSGK